MAEITRRRTWVPLREPLVTLSAYTAR